MNEIVVRLDWREVDWFKVQGHLARRFHGGWIWLAMIVVGILVFGVTYDRLEREFGDGLTGVISIGAALLCMFAITMAARTRLVRTMRRAPARMTETLVVVDADGIAAPGAMVVGRIPWDWVTEVFDAPEGLLLLFSPVEFVPLPDVGLPDGMTRERLKTQIEIWRETAA